MAPRPDDEAPAGGSSVNLPSTTDGGSPAGETRAPSPVNPRTQAAFFDDLRRVLSHPVPSEMLRPLLARGDLDETIPEVVAMVGIEQPAKSHGCDAFDHTMRVVDAARADQALRWPGDMETMLAALFHDVGKPLTKGQDPETGRITFHSHQFVGERLARRRLRSLGAQRAGIDADRVARLVRHHMFDLDVDLSEKAIRRFTRRLGSPEMTYKLLDLRIADKRGGARPDRIGAILAFRKRVRAEIERKEPFGLKDLVIDGNTLMEAGIERGPRIGATLKRLLTAVLENPDLNTREALLALALEAPADPCCD